MDKNKISIIIPVYNAADFLERCVTSVTNQTYKNIEILLINDGSTDNSGKICDELKSKDKRIEVIHKKNSGVSDTRNIGIEKATGKYITFIDSDDYIDKTMLEKLYINLIENKSDISICGLIKITEDKKILFETQKKKIIMKNKNEFLDELMLEKKFIGSLWGKLYKKDLFKDTKLDKNLKIAEDLDLLIRLSEKIKVTSTIGENLYYYYHNSNSVTKTSNFTKYSDELKVLEKNLNNRNINKKLITSRYLRININLFYKYRNLEPEKVGYCKNVIKLTPFSIGIGNYFTIKQKIKYILVKTNIIK